MVLTLTYKISTSIHFHNCCLFFGPNYFLLRNLYFDFRNYRSFTCFATGACYYTLNMVSNANITKDIAIIYYNFDNYLGYYYKA